MTWRHSNFMFRCQHDSNPLVWSKKYYLITESRSPKVTGGEECFLWEKVQDRESEQRVCNILQGESSTGVRFEKGSTQHEISKRQRKGTCACGAWGWAGCTGMLQKATNTGRQLGLQVSSTKSDVNRNLFLSYLLHNPK